MDAALTVGCALRGMYESLYDSDKDSRYKVVQTNLKGKACEINHVQSRKLPESEALPASGRLLLRTSPLWGLIISNGGSE